ncbi:hypothetical protein IMSAGC019_02166 [Lachnospiraceae bacterium]|nr:hypothetical protein IMSAGC019_02166 [Lachnospiraceae bacterium]
MAAVRVKIVFTAFLLFSAALPGCAGNRDAGVRSAKEVWENQRLGDQQEEEVQKSQGQENARDDTYANLSQLGIEDINDRGTYYQAYMPRGSQPGDGSAFYNGHGLYYFASVENYGGASEIYDNFENLYGLMLEGYQGPDRDYSDIKGSGILENGEDRYYILTARGRDYDGMPFESRQIEYRQVQPSGACISWRLEMQKEYADQETDAILEDMEKCYGISLAPLKTGSGIEPDTKEQDIGEEAQGGLEGLEGYEYLGLTTLSDYDRENTCPVMLPRGRDTHVRNGHASSFLHGVQVVADLQVFYNSSVLMTELKYSQDMRFESREGNTEKTKNVWKSAMMPVPGYGEALYSVISYEKKGNKTEEFFPRAEVLLDIRLDGDYYLALAIYLSGEKYDGSTNKVIRELERAYGIDLSEYYYQEPEEDGTGGNGGAQGEDPLTMAKLLGDGEMPEEEMEILPDTVLWFNATYAPLTYSNGWDWKLVGGIKPTEENIGIEKYLLKSSWGVSDRETAMEKARWLKEEGHRKACGECIKELEEMGLLELEEKEFQKKFLLSSLRANAYRYVIAYGLYHAGKDEAAMAAWDLCRLNQMYASYYICGYMTYEEAMDASLENSLELQEMFSSWEEMMESYLLGYQFWQSESGKKEDSPTQERYRIYEMLQALEDSPYKLAWDMELKKSW